MTFIDTMPLLVEHRSSAILVPLVSSLVSILIHCSTGVLQCPLIPGDRGNCSHSCGPENPCPTSLMCCYLGSCKTCLQPVDMPPSCENSDITCSDGQKCYLEIVECPRAPCYPQPVCADENQVSCQKLPEIEEGFPMDLCTDDSRCPIGRKCCSNGSGHDCQAVIIDWSVKPDRHVKPPVPTCETTACEAGETCFMVQQLCDEEQCALLPKCILEKKARCPAADLLQPCEMAADECSMSPTDTSCRKGTACCNVGCGNACMYPVLEAAGYCPDKPPDEGTHCLADTDCQLGYKCCDNKCSPVVLEKPNNISKEATTFTSSSTSISSTTESKQSTTAYSDNIEGSTCLDGLLLEDSGGQHVPCDSQWNKCPKGYSCHDIQAICCAKPEYYEAEATDHASCHKSSVTIILASLCVLLPMAFCV